MQLPPCGIYLLTFDEFHWVAARDRREFIDCIQFLWALLALLLEVNLAERG